MQLGSAQRKVHRAAPGLHCQERECCRGHTEKLRSAWLPLVSQWVGDRQSLLQAGRMAGGCCRRAQTCRCPELTVCLQPCAQLWLGKMLKLLAQREIFLSLPGLAHTHFISKMFAVESMTFCWVLFFLVWFGLVVFF